MVDTVELPAEHVPALSIIGTQCCGLHSLSGFQYHYKGKSASADSIRERESSKRVYVPVQLKSFVKAIQKTYAANKAMNTRVRGANDVERMAAYRESRHMVLPHPGYVAQPENRPALLLCTWNHPNYEPGAKALARQITDAGLGECTFTGYATNPNSGNNIAAMIWAIEVNKYDAYVKENGL